MNSIKKPDDSNPASDYFRLSRYLFYLIFHVDARYGEEIDKILRTHNIERIHWQVLLCLREKNPSSISELAGLTRKKLSTISRVIERMRKDGLVKCAPRTTDQRITDVHLQASGERALEKIITVTSKQYERALDGFNSEETKNLRSYLQRILDNLDRSPFE